MKKLFRRLGVAITALVIGAGSVSAQTDVTSQYLTNADFSAGWTTENVGSGTVKAVTGWTGASTGSDWYYGGAISYSGGVTVNSSTVGTNPSGTTTGGALGLSVGWGCTVKYTQAVTFPAGKYRISYKAYNANPDAKQVYNYIGFVENGGTEHYGYINNFISSTWMEDEIILNLTSATSGNISVGIGAVSGGSGANAKIFVDYIKIEAYNPSESNMVGAEVTPGSWTGNTGTYQSTYPEYFGEHFTGDAMSSSTTVENGKYDAYVYFHSHQAWKSQVATDGDLNSYIDAEGVKKSIGIVNNVGLAGYEPKLYHLSDIVVSDGSLDLKVGNAAQGGNWLTVKTEKIVKKIGATVGYGSGNFPISGATAMTQDYWYAYTVPVASDYTITSSDAATVYYTQDGTQAATGGTYTSLGLSANTASNAISLSAGTLYIKASAATTLSIAAASYSYNVGSAIVSHSYVQGGETVTVTYPDAATNNSGASLSVSTSGVQFNGSTPADLTATSNGFSFTVPSGLSAATNYTLAIPAGIVGYSTGNTYNEAQNIIFKTPTVLDGTYYLRTDDYKYLSRGSNWGSRAIVDEFGEMVTFTTDKDNKTSIRFFDSQAYLKKESSNNDDMYTDAGNAEYWYVTLNNGKYRLSHHETPDKFVRLDNGVLYRDGTTNIVDWTLEDYATRTTRVSAYPNNNIQSVIDASGAQTTVANFETYLGTLTATDLTNKIATAKFSGSKGDWNWVEPNNRDGNQPVYGTNYIEVYQETGTLSQTITGLSAGIYKVTVDAFERIGSSDNSKRVAESSTPDVMLAYLEANGMKTRLTQWYDVHTAAVAAGKSSADNYPNGPADGVSCFNEGYCTNTVYAYVGNSGELTIKLVKPSYIASNWLLANNFTLTLYSADLWPSLQAALQTYVPYDDVAAADDATGYTTQYNIFADYTQSTSQSDMQAAITYMQNNYANYQWAHASINHPVEVTEGIINDPACTDNNKWDIGKTGRRQASDQDETGTTRDLFYQNSEPDPVRGQTVTIPNVGAYMLKTWVRTVDAKAHTYAKIAISDGAYNGTGTYANAEDIAAAYGNESTAWRQVTNYFATTSADQQKTIYLNTSHGDHDTDRRRAYISRLNLYYIGQNADFVKDGVHKYIGTYSDATTLAPTDAAPIVDVTAATFSTAPTISLTSNPNGLIYAAESQNISAGTNIVKGTTCQSLVLADGHPFVNPTQFTASNATYTLTAAATKDNGYGEYFGTVMVPFAWTPSGVKAYTLDQDVPVSTDVIKGTQVTGSVAANSPVLVKKDNSSLANQIFTASNAAVSTAASGQTFTNGHLVGTYTAMAAPTGSFVMQVHDDVRLAFYRVGGTQPTVNPFRAYLQSASGAKSLTVVFDEVNGIEGLTPNPSPIGEGSVYSVGGARQNNLKKGVNIVRMSDGSVRKVIVK